jgi:hypothetical protein
VAQDELASLDIERDLLVRDIAELEMDIVHKIISSTVAVVDDTNMCLHLV